MSNINVGDTVVIQGSGLVGTVTEFKFIEGDYYYSSGMLHACVKVQGVTAPVWTPINTVSRRYKQPVCDCGGASVSEPHSSWCSIN